MTVIGLTGQTGSGKSTVSRFFTEQGIPCIDCDRVAREVVEPDKPALAEIAAIFGEEVLNPDRSLNRRALGGIVFADPEQLKLLNQTIFPHIIARINELLEQLGTAGYSIAVLDAPTLFESGANRLCDRIVGVIAPKGIRLQRIMQRDGLGREEALRRIDAQLDQDFFQQHCDVVVENCGTLQDLQRQAAEVCKEWIEPKWA